MGLWGWLTGSVEDTGPTINPATGLPILDGCCDVAGNPYGTAPHDVDIAYEPMTATDVMPEAIGPFVAPVDDGWGQRDAEDAWARHDVHDATAAFGAVDGCNGFDDW